MAEIVRWATILDSEGEVRPLAAQALRFGYRSSLFRSQGSQRQEVILGADLDLRPRSPQALRARMAAHIARRRATQPRLPSAGSVFKNPPGDHAGRLIEAAGLKGARRGDAMVSLEHANFIVNLGSARAKDVKTLIDQVRETVGRTFGVELALEIQLVGDWHGSCNQ
jgi:UDP-N-acetylmuramate dehydrogenase